MEEEIEVWKECGEGKICIYHVSNLGRVKSVRKKSGIELILKQTKRKDGYLRLKINKNNTLIHTLVAYNFIGPRPKGLQIDHIDRNKLNNRANNLRYITQIENQRNTSRYRNDILETDRKERLKILNKEYNIKNKPRHEKSKKHQNYLNNNI